MSKPLDLSSATAKFDRAKFHANELLEDITAWTHAHDDPPIRVRFEDDLKHRRTHAYAESLKAIPSDWSLILGDALHDYRSALNYVMGALVLVGRKPQAFLDPKSSFQFPVYETTRRDFFAKVGTSQAPGVLTKHLRAISPFQPYKGRGDRWALPTLKFLNDLDKHRKPTLATHYVRSTWTFGPVSVGERPPRLFEMRSSRLRGRVQPGAKLADLIWLTAQRLVFFSAPQVLPKSDMGVNFHPASGIVLEDLRPERTVLVRIFIERLNDLVESVIRKVGQV